MVPHLLPMRSLLSDHRDRLRNERSRWSEISDRHQPKSAIALVRNGRSGCSEIRNMSGPALEEGVETHDVGGVPVDVFGAAKTVADCFKFRNKTGTDVAVQALRDFRRQHPRELTEVWRYAAIDRVARVMRPYLESLE